MVIFNALLNLRELKELYSGKPVCVCPLYKGSIGVSKRFEISGNPIGENTFFTNGENMDIIYKENYFWSDEA